MVRVSDLHYAYVALVVGPLDDGGGLLVDAVVHERGDDAALRVVLGGPHGADPDLAAGLLVVGHHVDGAHEPVRLPHGQLQRKMTAQKGGVSRAEVVSRDRIGTEEYFSGFERI